MSLGPLPLNQRADNESVTVQRMQEHRLFTAVIAHAQNSIAQVIYRLLIVQTSLTKQYSIFYFSFPFYDCYKRIFPLLISIIAPYTRKKLRSNRIEKLK